MKIRRLPILRRLFRCLFRCPLHPLATAMPPGTRAVAIVFLSLCLNAFLPAFAPAGGTARDFHVGMRTFGVWNSDSNERFDFAVWYPAQTPSSPKVLDGWLVEASRRSRIQPGFFPVVLLSHDTAGSRFAHNDLAAAIASGGMVVIAPTHNGDNQSNSGKLYTVDLLRERPLQLLRALETVLDSPDFAPHVDESRIGMVGVGFGAISALQLAGARPDPVLLQQACGPGGGPGSGEDPFCAPWVLERFGRLDERMRALEKTHGAAAFTPPLALLAPALIPAPPMSPPPPDSRGPADPPPKPSLWARIFGGKNATAPAPPPEPEKPALPAAATDHSSDYGIALDFQGGPLFGGTGTGTAFVYFAMPDSPQFRVAVAEDTKSPASPVDGAEQAYTPLAHRRPAESRHIRGIALVAPAGGMLFTPAALANIRIPVAIVEASKDGLYAVRRHAQPYYAMFPVRPEVLQLGEADHFSLFARCSKDTLAILGESCGRLVGDERDNVAARRDGFLAAFFQSVLGEPLPEPAPSGFIAAPQKDEAASYPPTPPGLPPKGRSLNRR